MKQTVSIILKQNGVQKASVIKLQPWQYLVGTPHASFTFFRMLTTEISNMVWYCSKEEVFAFTRPYRLILGDPARLLTA